MDFVDTKSQQILVKINLPARKKDKNKHNQPGNKRVKSGFFCGAVRWVLLSCRILEMNTSGCEAKSVENLYLTCFFPISEYAKKLES